MKVKAVVSGTLGVKLALLRLGLYHLNLEDHLIEALLSSFLNRGPHLLLWHILLNYAVLVSPNIHVREGLAATDKPYLLFGGFDKSALIVKEGAGAGGLLPTEGAKFTLKIH